MEFSEQHDVHVCAFIISLSARDISAVIPYSISDWNITQDHSLVVLQFYFLMQNDDYLFVKSVVFQWSFNHVLRCLFRKTKWCSLSFEEASFLLCVWVWYLPVSVSLCVCVCVCVCV